MGLNPFKDSNLNDLQQNIFTFLSEHFSGISAKIKEWWAAFVKKGNERITLMFIPHSEKRIINFHISKFTISIILSIICISITVTSILIINHSSTIKEVSKLDKYKKNSKVQRQTYSEEIASLYKEFGKFKQEIDELHGLRTGKKKNFLWAKGGVSNPNIKNSRDDAAPPAEVLKMQEIDQDLKVVKDNMSKIKKFLAYRKKIIENTPSMWPVEGYIVQRYGTRRSQISLNREHYNGIDIEAHPASEIRATAPGKVNDIRWDKNLGLTIVIKHKYGFVTSYSHCQRVTVKAGQKVAKGEVIGYVGRTGKTTKYSCFYQIKIGTDFVDPMPYLNRVGW